MTLYDALTMCILTDLTDNYHCQIVLADYRMKNIMTNLAVQCWISVGGGFFSCPPSSTVFNICNASSYLILP